MEQEKVGKFIAVCRKEKQLTQADLAEKLNITNKAVSKSETGRGMPDASILLELSKILGVTVNELLSGEKLQVEEYKIKAEENIVNISKEKDKNKRKSNIVKVLLFISIIMIIFILIVLPKYLGGFILNVDEKITLSDLKNIMIENESLNSIISGNEKLSHIIVLSNNELESDAKAEILYSFKDDKCISERFKYIFKDEQTANEQYGKWKELKMINLVINGNEVCFNADANIGKKEQEILDNINMEYIKY